MIIQCPKCKTNFEVDDNALKNGEMKFQCAECAYVWTVNILKQEKKRESVEDNSVQPEEQKLPLCLVDEGEEKEVKSSVASIKKTLLNVFSMKNVLLFLLAVVFFGVVFLVAGFVSSSDISNSGKSIFDVSRKSDSKKTDLYIELAKPLTLVTEGTNDYIIIRGFIYNPSNVSVNIPKLVIRLKNADNRVLQEQEREVEVKQLAPLEKTDFMFKVFKFSSQVRSIEVDFIEPDKI